MRVSSSRIFQSGKKAKPVSNRWVTPIDARAGVNFKGLPTTKEDMGKKGPGYEIAEIQPHRKVSDTFTPESGSILQTSRNWVSQRQILYRQMGLFAEAVPLYCSGSGDPNDLILIPKTTQHLAYEPGKEYPKSLMGVIAVIRQTTFDAQHYIRMQTWAFNNPGGIRPEYNPALQSMAQSHWR